MPAPLLAKAQPTCPRTSVAFQQSWRRYVALGPAQASISGSRGALGKQNVGIFG